MVEIPKAAMYIWAKIPEPTRRWDRSSSPRSCSTDAKLAVSPGIGFGEYGDDHVRLALIENEARTRQAIRGIRDMFRKDGLLSPSQIAKAG
jgi:alanine-synthesizing transaminase